MRVVHVVRQFLPSVGGLEDVVLNLASYQTRVLRHEVRVVTLNRLFRGDLEQILPSRDEISGVKVTRIPYFGSSRYPIAIRILDELAEADIVHVHAIDFFFDFLALTRFLHRKPMVVSTHGGFFHTSFASRAKRIYFSSISRLSAMAYRRVIATSYNDGAIFARIVSPPVLQVVENGVDIDRFSGQRRSGLVRVLIYFGRWSANKGIPELFSLLRSLKSMNSDWRLVVAGREYDIDLAGLQSMATEQNVESSVTFAANPSVDELRGLIGSAGYFVSLSHHEGFGLTAIEALSAGLIPVLSDIPAYRRVVEQSGLGLICGESMTQAAIAIEEAHADYAGRADVIRAAASVFCKQYAWDTVGEVYEKVYQDVVYQ